MPRTYHKIITGDSRQMSELKDESIHLVVTSPPYWQLKDYGSEQQTGFHDDYETYINHLNLTWMECYRVLHPGCRLCINIGDQFARSVYYGRYKIIPIHTEIIKFCEVAGFDFMGSVIWQKATTMNTTGGASIMGSFPHPRNGIVKLDFEYILVNDGLAKIFTQVRFEESPPELDHAGDIDYLGMIGEKAFGIQIKPVTARSNFGNYSISERMQSSFTQFEAEYWWKSIHCI